MKKQILFVLLLALFAGTIAYGQALNGSAPRGINCTDSPLHPIAGKEYIYEAASNQPGNYTFWATKDVNFISTNASGATSTNMATTKLTTASGDLLTASGNYAASNAAKDVKITWSDAILSNTTAGSPTFVAVNQDGSCTNNFKVWAITPIKAFTVDIRNIENSASTPLPYGANEDQCFDQVRGATYNTVASQMEYNYGTQYLYFEVIAANFTNSWTPTFNLTGVNAAQTSVIEWTYQNPATTPWSATTVWNPASTVVTTNETNTSVGVSIYVRVTITNNNFEGIGAESIALAVDGTNSVGDWDIENNTLSNAGPLCNPKTAADLMDVATQTINPRPTITSTDPVNAPLAPGNETN